MPDIRSRDKSRSLVRIVIVEFIWYNKEYVKITFADDLEDGIEAIRELLNNTDNKEPSQ